MNKIENHRTIIRPLVLFLFIYHLEGIVLSLLFSYELSQIISSYFFVYGSI